MRVDPSSTVNLLASRPGMPETHFVSSEADVGELTCMAPGQQPVLVLHVGMWPWALVADRLVQSLKTLPPLHEPHLQRQLVPRDVLLVVASLW